ncbi:MAG: hypothetical protein CMN32_06065 [Saprospirales bacterium]|nr:hypothetical protein [Saprospirales bacterium]
MFRKLSDLFKNFFRSLFGKRDSTSPEPKPEPEEPLLEDSQDVATDTIETIPVPVDISAFADPDKDAAIDGPPATDTPTDDGGTTPEPPPTDPIDDGGQPEPAEPEPPVHTPRFLWCLDNGHGKLQAGKRSPKFELDGEEVQFFEYEFNRDIVQRIMKALDEKGVKYFDVVPDVDEVGSFLKERVQRVNDKESDLPKLFVSVHSNAGPAAADEWVTDSIKGAETWYAKGSVKGRKMAEIFQKHIVAKTGFVNRGLKSTKEKQLYVLVKTAPPAILTENGFYNNKEEVLELMKDEVRQKIADAHVAAIMEIEENGLD